MVELFPNNTLTVEWTNQRRFPTGRVFICITKTQSNSRERCNEMPNDSPILAQFDNLEAFTSYFIRMLKWKNQSYTELDSTYIHTFPLGKTIISILTDILFY